MNIYAITKQNLQNTDVKDMNAFDMMEANGKGYNLEDYP
jgi:hypothetical protein